MNPRQNGGDNKLEVGSERATKSTSSKSSSEVTEEAHDVFDESEADSHKAETQNSNLGLDQRRQNE